MAWQDIHQDDASSQCKKQNTFKRLNPLNSTLDKTPIKSFLQYQIALRELIEQ
jgi:hypothetical protein